MEIYFKQKLIIPSTPNFIGLKSAPTARQEGWKENPKIPIQDLADEQLEEIGKQWTALLVLNAQAKRLAGKLPKMEGD